MKTVGTIFGLGFIALLVFGMFSLFWLWGSYNTIVVASSQADTSWASVQTEYQRRFDLVPSLVGATKGTLAQEQAVFGAIAEARTKYAGAAPGSAAQAGAAAQYESALGRLLVVMENYPVLQSNQTVQNLMAELAGTENRVAVGRNRYNQAVQSYNILIKQFPRNMIAGAFGFQARQPFASEEGASKAPTVDLEIKR